MLNNSYPGLIRQAQRAFDMDDSVQLGFANANAPELQGAAVDHVGVAQGLGCKAIRVWQPGAIQEAFARARALMKEQRVPAVVEVMLERVTNIPMGPEIDDITKFEPVAGSLEGAAAA